MATMPLIPTVAPDNVYASVDSLGTPPDPCHPVVITQHPNILTNSIRADSSKIQFIADPTAPQSAELKTIAPSALYPTSFVPNFSAVSNVQGFYPLQSVTGGGPILLRYKNNPPQPAVQPAEATTEGTDQSPDPPVKRSYGGRKKVQDPYQLALRHERKKQINRDNQRKSRERAKNLTWSLQEQKDFLHRECSMLHVINTTLVEENAYLEKKNKGMERELEELRSQARARNELHKELSHFDRILNETCKTLNDLDDLRIHHQNDPYYTGPKSYLMDDIRDLMRNDPTSKTFEQYGISMNMF